MLKADPVQSNSSSTGPFTWRDKRYKQFYQIVDQLVDEIQANLKAKDGRAIRRLGDAGLPNLAYSTECIIRDCVSVVHIRKRVGKAVIRLGKHQYPASRPDKMLTYRTHVERAFQGLKQLGSCSGIQSYSVTFSRNDVLAPPG